MNYFNEDWKWTLTNAVDWDRILPMYHTEYPTEEGFESKEDVINFYIELLENTGKWASESLAEHAVKLDKEGAGKIEGGKAIVGETLGQIYRECKELDIFNLAVPKDQGGMEVPISVGFPMLGQCARACVASSTQIAFFGSIADMVHRFADKKWHDKIIPLIGSGDLSGCMCLTEPGCGSDLGAIKSIATKQKDGTYRITGSKMFITNAGGGVALVLAKAKGAPDDLTGLSLFLVEQAPEELEGKLNFEIVKNEEKMGLHGSFTCQVAFDNSIAHLMGEEGEGFKQMLHLMNEARIAVAYQALGGIEASLAYANKYAEERTQFGKQLKDLPLMKRNLEDWQTEMDALRALITDTTNTYDVYQRLHLKLQHTGELNKKEEELYKEVKLWTRKRTPLIKYYACEAFTLLSQRAIQSLGGYGYMEEYPVERYHRDSFGPLLYEGTSQIQALMALKDTIKFMLKDPKKFFSSMLISLPKSKIGADSKYEKKFNAVNFDLKKNLTMLVFKNLRPDSKEFLNPSAWGKPENFEKLMPHAETLCQALSYIETLRVLASYTVVDEAKGELFDRYLRLVTPRLESIYTDWKIRK